MIDSKIQPTEAERKLAVAIGQYAKWTPKQIEMTLAGEGDDAPIIQLLAEYRLCLLADLEAENARLREAAVRGFRMHPPQIN